MIVIRDLHGQDLNKGFLDCLKALSPVSITVEKAGEIFRWRLDRGYHTFVAVQDGVRVVGTATLIVEKKFTHDAPYAGRVEDVVVLDSCRHEGVGSSLLAAIERRARELGCYKVVLCCHDTIAPFYERAGYHRHDVGMRIDL